MKIQNSTFLRCAALAAMATCMIFFANCKGPNAAKVPEDADGAGYGNDYRPFRSVEDVVDPLDQESTSVRMRPQSRFSE